MFWVSGFLMIRSCLKSRSTSVRQIWLKCHHFWITYFSTSYGKTRLCLFLISANHSSWCSTIEILSDIFVVKVTGWSGQLALNCIYSYTPAYSMSKKKLTFCLCCTERNIPFRLRFVCVLTPFCGNETLNFGIPSKWSTSVLQFPCLRAVCALTNFCAARL